MTRSEDKAGTTPMQGTILAMDGLAVCFIVWMLFAARRAPDARLVSALGLFGGSAILWALLDAAASLRLTPGALLFPGVGFFSLGLLLFGLRLRAPGPAPLRDTLTSVPFGAAALAAEAQNVNIFGEVLPGSPLAGTVLGFALPLLAAWLPLLFYRTVASRRVAQLHRTTVLMTGGVVLVVPLFVLIAAALEQAPNRSYMEAVLALRPPAGFLCGLPVFACAFVTVRYPLFNLERIARRVLYYVALSLGATVPAFLALRSHVGTAHGIALPVSFLYLMATLVTAIVAVVLVLHFRYLRPLAPYIFLRDAFVKERALSGFVSEIQSLEEARESPEAILEILLQNIYRIFECERALIMSAVGRGRRLYRFIGPPPTFSARGDSTHRPFRLLRLRLNETFVQELDRVFLLEPGFPKPFDEDPRKHARTAAQFRSAVEEFGREGYQLLLPLIFRRSFVGLIVLGRKADGSSYYNGEIRMLDAARLPFAMAVQHNVLIESFRDGLAGVQAPVDALDQAAGEAVRIKIGENRTLLFRSAAMESVVDKTRRVAALPLPVLVQGETGTGKELIARLLHQVGPGESEPFVAVNCAAIPETLWESELFGHVRGTFTDARTDREGLVSAARNGTLFFDEIGEMPASVQPKILRLIQERRFVPLGARKELTAGCRLVFATHRDLSAMVSGGQFREDLYYRVSGSRIVLPPLRARPEDIPPLVEQLLVHYAAELGTPVRSVSREAMEQLVRYAWPGNIRELENTLISVITSADHAIIGPADLPSEVRAGSAAPLRGTAPTQKALGTSLLVEERLKAVGFEELVTNYSRELIRHALEKCGGNRTHAARMLKISRGKLIYRLRELGLE